MPSQGRKRIAAICCLVAVMGRLAGLAVRSRSAQRAIAGVVPGATPATPFDRMNDLPRVFLWAWERPEDLRFIDLREVGVAFLAETVYLRGERVVVRPRMQSLSLPSEA